jgi:hypothetical protein
MLKRKLDRGAAKPALAVVRPIDDNQSYFKPYADLEGELRDLERMATLASNLVQDSDEWFDRKEYQELLEFAVFDVLFRAANLRKQYYAGFDQSVRS